jgi:hypothetical protein
LKVLDTSRKFDPESWGYGYQLDSNRDTYNEFYANQQLLYALESGQQSIANVLASFLGLGPNQFQDYSRAAAIRSILMSRNPLAVVEYGDSQLSPDRLDSVRGLIKILSPVVNQETRDPNALTPTQKRLQDAENYLLYADIRNTAKTDLGFSVRNGLLAQSNWYSLLLGDSELNIARGMEDILAIRNRVDLSFNPELWWNALDPRVKQGFLDNDITPHLIYSARNADEANIRINEALVKNDVQFRVAQYKPTWVDEGRMLVDNLVGGVTNSPAAIPFVALGTIAAALYFWLHQRQVHAQSAAKKLRLHERVSE